MAVKKRRNKLSGVFYFIFSLLIILGILFLLHRLYYHLHPQKDKKIRERVITPNSQSEAFLQLEKIRNRKDFGWPIAEGELAGLTAIPHTAFSLGYSEAHEQAAWVAYILSRAHSKNAHHRRNNFRSDPKIVSESASPMDYTKSGFDRGHLAPAADFDFSKTALSETFYMSNISPQKPSLNRGKWKELEEQVRDWATEYDSLWVITGPVLEEGLKKIGHNRVSVPKYFYKIILDPKKANVKIIGFLMPNKNIKKDLRFYAVPVDSIEKLCKLDFFPQIPDLLEDSLEKKVQLETWFIPH